MNVITKGTKGGAVPEASTKVEVKSETVFTAAEVAEKLRTHRYTVYKLFKDGRLKGFRVSNQWRCTATELDRFMSASD